jgi:hypothetical protein
MVEAEMADAAGASPATAAAMPMDLESYVAPLSSPAKLDRLLWIAEQCAGTPLELEALKMAGDDVKKVRIRGVFSLATPTPTPTPHRRSHALSLSLSRHPPNHTKTKNNTQTLPDTYNVGRYHEVMARIGGRLGPDYRMDELSASAALFSSSLSGRGHNNARARSTSAFFAIVPSAFFFIPETC